MKKTFLCLALAFALCLSFAACSSPGEKEAGEETQVTETTQAPAKEKVFKTSDERFQITADESWSDAEELLKIKDATLALSKNAEGHIALISESKYNFSDKLSGYNNLVIKHMEKNLTEDKASESEEVRLGNFKAYKTTIAGKADDVAQVYQIYCAEINDRYVQLICWSLDSIQKQFIEDFDKIAQTLSPVKD